MAGHGEKLSRKQESAIAALLTAATIARAAKQAGVSLRTLQRWMKEPAFAAAYRQARRQVVDHAVTLLQSLCGSAVLALDEALRDRDVNSRTRAAKIVLDAAMKGVELADLAAQVDELREQVGG
jgi:hypothetical protein